jgi:hypothetical protein
MAGVFDQLRGQVGQTAGELVKRPAGLARLRQGVGGSGAASGELIFPAASAALVAARGWVLPIGSIPCLGVAGQGQGSSSRSTGAMRCWSTTSAWLASTAVSTSISSAASSSRSYRAGRC